MFSDDDIKHALSALTPIVPPGKRGALLAVAGTDGVKAMFAVKVNDVWQFDGEADWHGGTNIGAGVKLQATW